MIINAIIAKTKYNLAGVHIFCKSAILYNNTKYYIFLYTLISNAKLLYPTISQIVMMEFIY